MELETEGGKLTANFDWCLKLEEHGLLHEDLSSDLAQEWNVLLSNLDVASTWVDHLVDDAVYV